MRKAPRRASSRESPAAIRSNSMAFRGDVPLLRSSKPLKPSKPSKPRGVACFGGCWAARPGLRTRRRLGGEGGTGRDPSPSDSRAEGPTWAIPSHRRGCRRRGECEAAAEETTNKPKAGIGL